MHAQVAAWRDAFADAPLHARRVCDGLDGITFNAAPEAGRWSVGQCLDHLLRTGGPLVDRLELAVADLRKDNRRADAPYALGFVGRRFAALNGPGGGKAKTPSTFKPADTVGTPDEVLTSFCALNERLGRIVELGDGLDLGAAKVSSPALSLLRLNVAAWLETTMQHQRRHLLQAERARAALGV